MIEQLTSEGRTIEIRVNSAGINEAPTPGSYINIDPSRLGNVLTPGGNIPTSLERAISHEFGHAVFGDSDAGMVNIIRNENPIMKELGEPSRIQY